MSISVLLLTPPSCFSQRVINVPADAPTVQTGIDEARDGDTVRIALGMYFEEVSFHGKAITVKGVGPAQGVRIDADMKGPVFSFTNGEGRSSVLTNLTIEHGSPANLGNPSVPAAGGILISNAAPSIIGVRIIDNVDCGIGSFGSSPLIIGSTVSETSHNLTASGCPNLNPSNGSSQAKGTGIYIDGQSSARLQSVVSGNTVSDNMNDILVGSTEFPGLTILDGGSVLVSDNVITNNISRIGYGSGISIRGSTSASVTQNLVFANVEDATPLSYSTSAFEDEGGINISVSSNATVYLTNNTVASNVYVSRSRQENNQGTQLLLGSSGTIIASNNLFIGADTLAPVECVDPSAGDVAGSVTLSYNDIYSFGGLATYDGNRCAGLTGRNGNISVDPLFLDLTPGSPNFQLKKESVAVDAGTNTAAGIGLSDILGNVRIQNAKGLPTSIIDMGAYEHAGVPSPPPPPDFTLSLSSTHVTTSPTTPGVVQVTMTPTSSLQTQVQMSCSSQTTAVQCKFLPSIVALSDGVPELAQLTVSSAPGGATPGVAAIVDASLPHLLSMTSRVLLSLSWLPLSFCFRVAGRRRAFVAVTVMLAGFCILELCGCVHAYQKATTANVVVIANADSGQQHSVAMSLSITP